VQAIGGQKETISQFAHEREIRPTKRFSRHGFGKNTKHHHTKYCSLQRVIILSRSNLITLNTFSDTNNYTT
jgi:hypothetical protein